MGVGTARYDRHLSMTRSGNRKSSRRASDGCREESRRLRIGSHRVSELRELVNTRAKLENDPVFDTAVARREPKRLVTRTG
jgi:hypothetical protein